MNKLTLKNQSSIKPKQNITLPPISTSQTLKYQPDYQNYEDELQKFKTKNNEQLLKPDSPSSSSKNLSISSSSSQKFSKSKSKQKDRLDLLNSPQKIILFEESPNFWKSTEQNPYIQYQEKEQYRNKSIQEIENQIKLMRNQLIKMNKKLSERLNQYHLAKTQFVAKKMITSSKSEFYQAQIETNKKTEQAQIAQIKKLNQTEIAVKDKDVLIDLEQILIELKQQIHHVKKEEHDSKLKNHKQDLILNELIRVNNENKDNNAIKLLKLRMVYYMKRQNFLKNYEQQLNHQHKLIQQNDKNLDRKLQQLKKANKGFFMFDENYDKMKTKYQQLQLKNKTIVKCLQSYKKSNEISEEKYARQILEIDVQLQKHIKPTTLYYQQKIEELQNKINTLINSHNLHDNAIKNIKDRFSEHLIYKPNLSQKSDGKNIQKPNLRPKSKLSQNGFLTERIQQKKKTSSNQKNLSNRYNDKNVSMTIDVCNEEKAKLRSISDGLDNLKPKIFRIQSKGGDKQIRSKTDKTTSYSTIIDYASLQARTFGRGQQIQKARLLKPNFLSSRIQNK